MEVSLMKEQNISIYNTFKASTRKKLHEKRVYELSLYLDTSFNVNIAYVS